MFLATVKSRRELLRSTLAFMAGAVVSRAGILSAQTPAKTLRAKGCKIEATVFP
jgi:hypothetical protein